MKVSSPPHPALDLQAPPPQLFEKWRMLLVDAIKCRALRLLHKTQHGELRLLRLYFLAEGAAVSGIAIDVHPLPMPAWMVQFNTQHMRDEGLHVKLFSDAIKARGGQVPKDRSLDWLSRRKVGKWLAIAERYRSRFGWEKLVPACAIVMCAEQMAVRILGRHCRAIAPQHPLYALLSRVWSEETQHVNTFAEALNKLVRPEEQLDFNAMLAEIRRVERAWSLTTAIGLYALACTSLCQAGLNKRQQVRDIAK